MPEAPSRACADSPRSSTKAACGRTETTHSANSWCERSIRRSGPRSTKNASRAAARSSTPGLIRRRGHPEQLDRSRAYRWTSRSRTPVASPTGSRAGSCGEPTGRPSGWCPIGPAGRATRSVLAGVFDATIVQCHPHGRCGSVGKPRAAAPPGFCRASRTPVHCGSIAVTASPITAIRRRARES